MREGIGYHTGDFGFAVSFYSDGTKSGNAQISFGCEGISQKAFSVFLESGNILDMDGILVGSYLPYERATISGRRNGDSCILYYNQSLVRTNMPTSNIDVDFIDFSKSGTDANAYRVTYETYGYQTSDEKTAIYISKSGDYESGILSILSGMNIFNAEDISVQYGELTGVLSEEDIGNLNEAGLVLFGQKTEYKDFYDPSGWSRVSTPIVFLNPLVYGQSGLGIVSGQEIQSNGYDMTFGIYGNSYGSKADLFNSVTRIAESGESGYALFDWSGQKYMNTPRITDVLLYDSGTNSIMTDIIDIGTIGYLGYVQSGRRAFFNTPIFATGSISEISTEDWKKIFVATVYDLSEINTKITEGGSSSSKSSSSSSSVSSSSRSSSSSSSMSSSSSRSSSSRSSSSTSSSSASSGTAYVVDFEGDGETKIAYGKGDVVLNGLTWTLSSALIGTSVSDKKNGARSLRFTTVDPAYAQINGSGFGDGLRRLSFNYAAYGTDLNQQGMYAEYHTGDSNWVQIGNSIMPPYPTGLSGWTGTLPSHIDGEVWIRIRTDDTNLPGARINVDDILLEPF